VQVIKRSTATSEPKETKKGLERIRIDAAVNLARFTSPAYFSNSDRHGWLKLVGLSLNALS